MKQERRRYIRLSTVLPVEFFVLGREKKRLTPWLQGFTRDISKGGICLLINDLWQGFWERFNDKEAELLLNIHLPFRTEPFSAKAKVIWIREEREKDFNQYLAGLEFFEADKIGGLFKYALFKKFLPFFVGGLIFSLCFFSFFLFWKARLLIKENRKLVAGYVNILEKSRATEQTYEREKEGASIFKKKEEELNKKLGSLERKLFFSRKEYQNLLQVKEESEVALKEAIQFKEKVSVLEEKLAVLRKQDKFLKAKARQKEAAASIIYQEARDLTKEKLEFSQKIREGMFNWIKNRQDLIGGLVLSYEGDRDLDRVCFTYDQAIATIVFLLYQDNERAQKILDFYLKKINKGEDIYNAYDIQGNVFEYTVHSGPNAWIGIAALNYVKKTQDKKYLEIAKRVGDFLLEVMDKEGGVRGGTKEDWYSTEHNLDAFAFFNLFYQLTGQKKYLELAEKIKSWLSRYSYSHYGPPVKRGKGDATIATDTYAWSITALGPAVLFSLGMNPSAILEFAIENCQVETEFERQEGSVTVQGFDFAKYRNLPQQGVISCEWTAQMILAFEIMADYYKDTNPSLYEEYFKKALFYFQELQKMLITSPSRVGREDPCLPYASRAFIDTGHGWRTPKGNKTGSLSSTGYFLIVYFGYNPLRGEFLNLSLAQGG